MVFPSKKMGNQAFRNRKKKEMAVIWNGVFFFPIYQNIYVGKGSFGNLKSGEFKGEMVGINTETGKVRMLHVALFSLHAYALIN